MDIPSSAKTFEYFANHLEEYLKSETKQLENSKSYLVRESNGVVVLIVPWNYPLLIASWKMSQALAAGNTVILKPSSLTPLTALELGRIIHGAGLPTLSIFLEPLGRTTVGALVSVRPQPFKSLALGQNCWNLRRASGEFDAPKVTIQRKLVKSKVSNSFNCSRA